MMAARIYRYLTMVKRAGRGVGVVVPGRRPEDITTPCFTCPIPDFNLPSDWRDTPEYLRYVTPTDVTQTAADIGQIHIPNNILRRRQL